MKKDIYLKLSAWLILFFSLLVTKNAFSQVTQANNSVDTTSKITSTTPLNENSTYVKGITAGRAKSLIGTAFGLVSLALGLWAKSRSNKKVRSKRAVAAAALILGLISIVLSVLHLFTSYNAALGSGSGKAGAIFALVLSLIGMILSGFVLRQKEV